MSTGELLEEESYEYEGPIAEAKGKGGGGGSTQTIQKADPWSGVQPYLTDFYGNVDKWYDTFKGGWYPGSPVVPYTNSNWQTGHNYTWGGLSDLYNTQRQQIYPMQQLTNMFNYDLSNPYSTGMPSDMANAYGADWNSMSANPYLATASALAGGFAPNIGDLSADATGFLAQAQGMMPDYRNLETTINFEDANPYLEQQIADMRYNAQKQLEQSQLANQDLAVQAGGLGSSRDVMQEMLLDVEGQRAMNQAETGMRGQAWSEMLREQTARGQIEAQNQANILGYLGQGYGNLLGFGQGMAGTDANLQAQLAQIQANYGQNALNQVLGYGQGMMGTEAGYESALADARLGYAGDRQSNWLDYLTDADRNNAVLYGLAPQIYGMNQQAQLAPYQTKLAMGDYQFGLGDQSTGYQQALRNNDIARYEYNRDLWQNKLNQMNTWLHGMGGYGTTSTSAQSPAGSPWLGALGGGMMGMAAQNSLMSMPAMTGFNQGGFMGSMLANPMMGFGLGALFSLL
jgi:hypothetical protein